MYHVFTPLDTKTDYLTIQTSALGSNFWWKALGSQW